MRNIAKRRMINNTSIMWVLGEIDDELKEAMADFRSIDVDLLTLGQYLQVTIFHVSLTTFRGLFV